MPVEDLLRTEFKSDNVCAKLLVAMPRFTRLGISIQQSIKCDRSLVERTSATLMSARGRHLPSDENEKGYGSNFLYVLGRVS